MHRIFMWVSACMSYVAAFLSASFFIRSCFLGCVSIASSYAYTALHASSIKALPPPYDSQAVGDCKFTRLFWQVAGETGDSWDTDMLTTQKVTGMLIEIGQGLSLELLESEEQLESWVAACLAALAAENEDGAPGPSVPAAVTAEPDAEPANEDVAHGPSDLAAADPPTASVAASSSSPFWMLRGSSVVPVLPPPLADVALPTASVAVNGGRVNWPPPSRQGQEWHPQPSGDAAPSLDGKCDPWEWQGKEGHSWERHLWKQQGNEWHSWRWHAWEWQGEERHSWESQPSADEPPSLDGKLHPWESQAAANDASSSDEDNFM
jgi:hypothetical protein